MWDYSDKVMDHFLNPRNVGEIKDADGVGDVGNISCGDALKLTFKLDNEGRIVDAKFKTFGCASAIASSSALTELIKGKTLEEAEKITNKDIVEYLGELPEEKIHCSVMGMEALEAAIANYRGETINHDDDDHEGRIVCKCFGVTDIKIRKVAKENNVKDAHEVKNYCKAGGACGLCLDEIQTILDGIWSAEENNETNSDDEKNNFDSLSIVQKVIKIQEIIDREIKPALENDGGSIEFINLEDNNTVLVELKGRCAMCASSQVTLKNLVEAKLQEFLSPNLIVKNQ
ncbi:Fe-S cluster assembly protein NifU [Lentisphaerota bacterium WC36G]|nr:Fe-S cluster assembly protein NifU [Lentisphaerae bacterium WC36]